MFLNKFNNCVNLSGVKHVWMTNDYEVYIEYFDSKIKNAGMCLNDKEEAEKMYQAICEELGVE